MATLYEEENGHGRVSSKCSNNNNNTSICKRDIDTSNNNNEDAKSTKSSHTIEDPAEIKLKKQALEQRKQDLEKLLNEKSWLLQQLQKTENQILNGNCEYASLDEILDALALQYKQDQQGQQHPKDTNDEASGGSDSAILRRKNLSRENLLNNNPNSNRHSEVSNRSSEYDNYPTLGAEGGSNCGSAGATVSATGSNIRNAVGSSVSISAMGAQQQMPIKSALKKRSTPTPTPGNANFLQMHRQQHLMQQQQMLYQQQQQQQQQRQYQSQPQAQQAQFDAVSLYSVNSANVATLRQQQVAPQQQPIIVQCDKYYLSPTSHSYNEGGFIRSSQNIKQYVSPLSSPKHYEIQYHVAQQQHPVKSSHLLQHHLQQQKIQHSPLHGQTQDHRSPMQQLLVQHQYSHHSNLQSQQQQQQQQQQLRLDSISLAPSYISVESIDNNSHQTRWRSQSHLPTSQPSQQSLHHQHSFHHQTVTSPIMIATERDSLKSHSSDMLATSPYYASPVYAPPPPPPVPSASTKPKPLDEISISSVNSDTQKKSKPKQWLESSLDGPIIRSTPTIETVSTSHLPTTQHIQKPSARERAKLSSQSMSATPRHYSLSSGTRDNHSKPLPNDSFNIGSSKLLQDDENRYNKLSQSTSYLNKMETCSISAPYLLDSSIEISSFKYLPPKPAISSSTTVTNTVTAASSSSLASLMQRNTTNTPQPPPPRPPPLSEKHPPPPPPPAPSTSSSTTITPASSIATLPSPTVNSSLSPDIRIESPKNMTVVKQATFQPYKEVTKPFEMSDFYKYSTKFRQKETSSVASSTNNNNNNYPCPSVGTLGTLTSNSINNNPIN